MKRPGWIDRSGKRTDGRESIRRIGGWCLCGALAVVLALAAGTVRADTGEIVTLPVPGKKLKSGWTVEVDCRTVSANGYQPMRFRVSLLPPGTVAKSNRTLRIEVQPQCWYGARTLTVGQFLEIPQGATGAECTILVPRDREMHQVDLNFYEDGEHLEDVSGPIGIANWGGNNWSEARPGILVLHSEAPLAKDRETWSMAARTQLSQGRKSELLPDLRPLAQLTGENSNSAGYTETAHPTDPYLIQQLRTWPRIDLAPPRDLPKRWLEYSSYDMIFITWPDLQKLVSAEPEAWNAIRAWTTAGRVLCIAGAGENFDQLAALEQLAGLPPLKSASAQSRRGWNSPPPGAFRDQIASLMVNRGGGGVVYSAPMMVVGPGGVATPAAVPEPNSPAMPPTGFTAQQQALARSSFVWRGWGTGAVVAFAAENPFPGSTVQWNGLFNSLPPSYWMWYQRHGMSLNRPNSGFWTGWIPGIGKAPVLSFLIMISVFTVIIGPVNYFWLRRRHRAYLMLVTVPVGAGLVTLLLLVYAMVADGLGMRTRLRSFSWVDQRTGQAVTWSRQTYYAGLAPTRGLLFPDDSAVFPLELQPNVREGDNRPRLIEWTEQGQQLKSGYLTSRTMQQFLVVQSGRRKARLDIRVGGPQRPPEAVNRLGSAVSGVLVSDPQGGLYWSDGGPDGGALNLEPIELYVARKKISDRINAAPLEGPPGAEAMERNQWRRGGYYYGVNVDPSSSPPSVFSSVLELQLRNANALDDLPPRSYLAFTSDSPLVPVGVETYVEAGSLHLIWGQW